MLNRRHLRIKILQALYAFSQSENRDIRASEKELDHSIEKMYDMYLLFLMIFGELHHFAETRIEDRKRKRLPTKEDLNPNRSFVDNQIVHLLKNNKMLNASADKRKVNWVGDIHQDMLKKMFIYLTESEVYQEFMESDESGFDFDKKFVVQLFKKEICNFNLLHNEIEEKSIYWQDDVDHISSMILKTLKAFKEGDDEFTPILPLFKDDEEEFVEKLFKGAIKQEQAHDAIIAEHAQNWESDRLAKMDTLLMNLAITEAKAFPSIPLKVTLNEYIEISKYYSTPKSNSFINGVLDKVFSDLTDNGEIRKIGRGLIQ